MNSDTFIDILKNGDETRLAEFVLQHGKKQKPVCPIYFLKDCNINNSKEEKENETGREETTLAEEHCGSSGE